MDDLVQFLRARLEEDERVAREAASSQPNAGEWQFAEMQVRAGDGAPVTKHTWVGEGTHIARHDPARVLREVDAKQKLLVLHRPVTRTDFTSSAGEPAGPMVVCHECDANTSDADWPDRPCWTLRYLALPYAGHPDYRQEWRP